MLTDGHSSPSDRKLTLQGYISFIQTGLSHPPHRASMGNLSWSESGYTLQELARLGCSSILNSIGYANYQLIYQLFHCKLLQPSPILQSVFIYNIEFIILNSFYMHLIFVHSFNTSSVGPPPPPPSHLIISIFFINGLIECH